MDSPPSPHLLVLPYPLQGHITPLMQLSKLLASRGFSITFVTTDFILKQMLKARQALPADDLHRLGITLTGISDGLHDLHERNCMLQPLDFVASVLFMQTSFDELVGRMVQEQGRHISCIISDSFLLGSQDVADKWHIPRIAYWPNSLAALACCISLPRIMAESSNLDPFKPQVYEEESQELVTCIPGIPEIQACMLPFHTLGGENSELWMRHHIESQIQRVNKPLCFIVNSFPELERDIYTHFEDLLPSKPILPLGPLLPSTFLGGHDDPGTGSSLCDEDEECMQWLDKQTPKSVLYISLGSISTMDEKDLLEFASGLLASNQPFLWVFRPASCESPPDMEMPIGKVIKWAPQLRVLSHEAIGGFLTHCGWNSTLESLSLGVPMLAWPHMLDQLTNCWFLVEKLKVGLRLELDESKKVGRIGVENGIRKLMQEEEAQSMRDRASKFQHLAQSYFKDTLASSLDSLLKMIVSCEAKNDSHEKEKPKGLVAWGCQAASLPSQLVAIRQMITCKEQVNFSSRRHSKGGSSTSGMVALIY
ncbi:hypothetical protein GOP47_0002871 [Adiantum capillus-veneris]|uniref:Glycosyltransferase n=1 Tax=Adiantum capillus-veneris TaxID=13818 RepID=A0A9D4VBC9_ADICA|nr:hypothetical protein GOP47_0002871 [Adiantum capillus-veneris]